VVAVFHARLVSSLSRYRLMRGWKKVTPLSCCLRACQARHVTDQLIVLRFALLLALVPSAIYSHKKVHFGAISTSPLVTNLPLLFFGYYLHVPALIMIQQYLWPWYP